MADGIYTIQAPIVIMDDSSFATYFEQIGVSSAENGSVVLNRIWDNKTAISDTKNMFRFCQRPRTR